MTENQIESLPALLESNYGLFRGIIRDQIAESLENGDVIGDAQAIIGDFLRALSHSLSEYDAPKGALEAATSILDSPSERLAKMVMSLSDSGELGSGMLAQMQSQAKKILS